LGTTKIGAAHSEELTFVNNPIDSNLLISSLVMLEG
jgi:hypothetical protein